MHGTPFQALDADIVDDSTGSVIDLVSTPLIVLWPMANNPIWWHYLKYYILHNCYFLYLSMYNDKA